MSFHRWLQNLRSAIVPSRGKRTPQRRGLPYAATYRLLFESLEERRLLAVIAPVDYAVGTAPQDVVTADFNHDGQLDLATANGGSNSVSVRFGDGASGFGVANHFATGVGPRSMTVGDFNNDGHLDLVTVNDRFAGFVDSVAQMSVLLANGDGTFRPPVNTDIWAVPLSVATADFNADGNVDLVYTSWNLEYSAVEVLLGDGQGGFVTSDFDELYDTWSPVGLAVADLNADGKFDVVTANADADTVSVLLGNSDGTLNYGWSDADNFATGLTPRAVAVGDFTGDGIPDLVTAGQAVDVLPGLGDGTFGSPIHHSVNSIGMTTVATADFNGDGNLDVVTADPAAGVVSVLLGGGDGTFAPPIDYATGSSPKTVALGDFNGDGRPDVAAENGGSYPLFSSIPSAGSNSVSVLLNDGNWTSLPPTPPAVSIRDVTVNEGHTGTRAATFIVTLSAVSNQPVTVAYATANGTASGSDFQAASGTLTIPAGQTTGTITVLISGDRVAEPSETFFVNLTNPISATLADGQGISTIVDDEPQISISDVSKSEGRNGTITQFTFTVTLSVAYDQPVTMSYRTVNGTATTRNGDYVAKSGTVTFAAGETTKSITINVKGDSKREGNETFYLDLFGLSGNALFTKSRGIGMILNDD